MVGWYRKTFVVEVNTIRRLDINLTNRSSQLVICPSSSTHFRSFLTMSSFWRHESHASWRMRAPTDLLTTRISSNSHPRSMVELGVFETAGRVSSPIYSCYRPPVTDHWYLHYLSQSQCSLRQALDVGGMLEVMGDNRCSKNPISPREVLVSRQTPPLAAAISCLSIRSWLLVHHLTKHVRPVLPGCV